MKKLFIYFLFIGCSNITPQQAHVPSDFQIYLDVFLSKARENNVTIDPWYLNHLVVKYDYDIKYPTLGQCSVSLAGSTIKINPVAWMNYGVSDREQLMFHELGHCLLNLKHRETTLSYKDYFGGPGTYESAKSLMYPYHIPYFVYTANRDFFIKELFLPNTSIPVIMYYNGPSQFNESDYGF